MAKFEALRVVHVFAIIETEHLFVKVAIEMKRLHSNVGSRQASLEKAPEVFDSVRVDATANVFLGVIHHLMHEALAEFVVADRVVGVQRGAVLDVFQNLALKSLALHVGNDRGANLPKFTIQDALNNRLAQVAALLLVAESAILVHVSDASADPSFIGFDFALCVLRSTAKLCVVMLAHAKHVGDAGA